MCRFTLAASKVGQGVKALLDMTTAEPLSNEVLEDAIVDSFLDGHEGLGFSEVQWTGIDDVSLLFQDDTEFGDPSKASKGASASDGYTSNSCTMSVCSPSDTSVSDNTSPPSPQQASACTAKASLLPASKSGRPELAVVSEDGQAWCT